MAMETLRVIPWRWLGHGVSMRAVAIGGDWCFFVDDVRSAFGPLVDWDSAAVTTVAGLPGDDDQQDLIAGDEVARVVEAVPMAMRTPALDSVAGWFAAELREWRADHDHLVAIASDVDADPGRTAPEQYTVATAARILSRDPGIGDLGRDRLYAVLEAIGWATRAADDRWSPTPEVRSMGWLTSRPTRIKDHGGRPGVVYYQPIVTGAGLAELHRQLGGMRPLVVDPAVDLEPLVELP